MTPDPSDPLLDWITSCDAAIKLDIRLALSKYALFTRGGDRDALVTQFLTEDVPAVLKVNRILQVRSAIDFVFSNNDESYWRRVIDIQLDCADSGESITFRANANKLIPKLQEKSAEWKSSELSWIKCRQTFLADDDILSFERQHPLNIGDIPLA